MVAVWRPVRSPTVSPHSSFTATNGVIIDVTPTKHTAKLTKSAVW